MQTGGYEEETGFYNHIMIGLMEVLLFSNGQPLIIYPDDRPDLCQASLGGGGEGDEKRLF